MTSLTAIFGISGEKPDEHEGESEKLLNLYWNRAELKKEFAELRNEKYRLQEQAKEHVGSIARLQQKLDHLENMLLDPEWVYNVVTFFQLRSLNLRCQAKLSKFAEELKQQREKRQHRQQVDNWNRHRAEEAAAVEQQICEQRLQVQLLEDRLQAERHRLATMSGFARLFRGRSLTASLDNLAENIEVAHSNETLLLAKLDGIEKSEPPHVQGLDTVTKRTINFMILSFAQQMYLHFRNDELAAMAKEASEKSIGAINYGGKDSCDEVLARVRKKLATIENTADLADVLQQRAKLLAAKAKFRDQEDAVPVAASVSTVYAIARNGTVTYSEANLLGENYWNLSNLVSR